MNVPEPRLTRRLSKLLILSAMLLLYAPSASADIDPCRDVNCPTPGDILDQFELQIFSDGGVGVCVGSAEGGDDLIWLDDGVVVYVGYDDGRAQAGYSHSRCPTDG